jgi:hypothetical protein
LHCIVTTFDERNALRHWHGSGTSAAEYAPWLYGYNDKAPNRGSVISAIVARRDRQSTIISEGRSIMRNPIFALAALLALAIAGCQNASSTPTTEASMAGAKHAVLVSGGNSGNGYTIFLQSDDPNNPTVLCSPGMTVCPVCKAAAIKYFQTGVFEPTCSRTGATRTLLIPATPTNGYQ